MRFWKRLKLSLFKPQPNQNTSHDHQRKAHRRLVRRYMLRASVRMWLLNIVILTAGIGLLLWTHGTREAQLNEIRRDLGIALIIAAIATLTYEAYARERFAVETLEDMLGKVIGDIVDPQTWTEMRQQILEKTAVRRATTVRVKIKPLPDDDRHRAILWTLMEYRLTGLRSHNEEVHVFHWLDKYMKEPAIGLPRFIRIEINGVKQHVAHGATKFEFDVPVGIRGSRGVPIVVEREELVYLPGAYTLIMSELTELESVSVWEADDIEVEVNCLLKEARVHPDAAFTPQRTLLPGQCVEFRFWHKQTRHDKHASAVHEEAHVNARAEPPKDGG